MRRSAIHIAESSNRSSRNAFTWSSSSRSFRCASPSCRSFPRSIDQYPEPLRCYTTSAGSSSSKHMHVHVHGHGHSLNNQGDDGLSLSRNARGLHSSARASAASQAQTRVEYDDQSGSWDYPDEETLPLMRDHAGSSRARGQQFRLAEAPDDWVLGGEYDLTPPSIPEYQHDQSPIIYEYDLPPPPLDDYDPTLPTTSTSKRRKKRAVRERDVAPMPPLPAGEMPEDGLSRFDWRDTSLSAKPIPDSVGRGRLWYPHLAGTRRRKADKLQLQDGDTFHDEIKRYINHFEPLLQAEHDEAERMLLQRLKDWSSDRLDKEGFMLEKLGARVETKMKPVEGVLVTFNKTGKDDKKPLTPHHKFDIGSYVFLSRTSPTTDPVLEDGSIQEWASADGEIDPSSWLKAKVYSRAKHYVRLVLPCHIPDLEKGYWRLDMGMSDWSFQMQLQAIRALHNDPISQDTDEIRYRLSSANESKARYTRTTASTSTSTEESEESAIDGVLAQMDQIKNKVDQTILNGTSIRDILLRAFQTDYLPLSSSAETETETEVDTDRILTGIPVIPEATAMKPTDIDATPLPTPHAHSAPRGVLARDQMIQSWTRRYRSSQALEVEGDPIIPLNQSQLRAIAMMLSERVSLVQGPPGTGKTRVIVETIKLLKSHWKIPHPILVCAHTNVAVDNLLAGLRGHGIKAIRTGSSDRVRDDLREYTFDHIVERHPMFPAVDALKKELENIAIDMRSGGREKNFTHLQRRQKELRSQIYGLESLMNREILSSADVICTTCLSSASRKLDGIDFPIVFLDEASMATEPLSIVPLMKGSSHVAIIGDHKQLPPVIISPEAHAGGLATSLFERLIHEKHIPSVMLDTQYRMHPSISAYPNKAFYAGALADGTVFPSAPDSNSDTDSDGRSGTDTVLPGFEAPMTAFLVPGKNVTFLDHDHPESAEMSSLANHGDANIVCNVVADLMYNNPDLKGSQIGVIAPYTAQVRLITQHLLSHPEKQEAFKDILGPDRAEELEGIEVKTVDGFEGREKDVMIVSMVRCNPGGWVGFLGDWRRLNVALTRARKALLIIGSSRTLGKAKVGKFAEETLPQGGAEVLRNHIRHLKNEGLILHAD